MCWFQTFGNINIDPTSTIRVNGGACPTGPTGALLDYRCSSAPGLGGHGLFQFEDNDGNVPINFIGVAAQAASFCGTNQQNPPTPAGHPALLGPAENICALLFPFSTNIQNAAVSTFFDSGYGAPEYLDADAGDEQFTLGNVPGGSVLIEYQGAPEDFNNPGTPSPDPGTYSPWVAGNARSSLTGFRFIRFRATVSYDPPPASTASNTFPAVQQVRIDYLAPIGCP
jgi:hypothetical protein